MQRGMPLRPSGCHGVVATAYRPAMSTTAPATHNLDHVTALATRYVEEHLDGDPLQWGEVQEHLKARGYVDVTTAVSQASERPTGTPRPLTHRRCDLQR